MWLVDGGVMFLPLVDNGLNGACGSIEELGNLLITYACCSVMLLQRFWESSFPLAIMKCFLHENLHKMK